MRFSNDTLAKICKYTILLMVVNFTAMNNYCLLGQKIPKGSEETIQEIDDLNDISWKLRKEKVDSSLLLAQQAYQLSLQDNYKLGEALSLTTIGLAWQNKGRFDSSKHYLEENLKVRSALRDTVLIASAHNNLGKLYGDLIDNTAAEFHFRESLRLYEKLESVSGAATVYNNLGVFYKNQGSFEKSLEALTSSLSRREALGHQIPIGKTLMNLGNLFERMGHREKSLEYYGRALNLFDQNNYLEGLADINNNIANVFFLSQELEKAKVHYSKSLEYEVQLNNGLGIAETNFGLALIFKAENRTEEAVNTLFPLTDSFYKGRKPQLYGEANLRLGQIYVQEGNWNESIFFLKNALDIANSLGNRIIRHNALEALAQAHAGQLDFKSAFDLGKKLKAEQDSINQHYRKARDLELKLTNERARNVQLNEQNKLLASRNQQDKLVLFFLSSVLVFLAIIFFFYRTLEKRKNKLVLLDTKLHDLASGQETLIVNAMIEGQDEERHRIGINMHDQIGGDISTLLLNLKNALGLEVTNELETTLNNAVLLADKIYDEVRSLSHALSDGFKMDEGLVPVIGSLVETITKNSNIKIELFSHGIDDKRIPYTIELQLYRIINEILINAVKHASPQTIEIQINKRDGWLNLIIEDDGKGFDATKLKGLEGRGLQNLNERVSSLDGKYTIDSTIGKGTSIIVDIPVLNI